MNIKIIILIIELFTASIFFYMGEQVLFTGILILLVYTMYIMKNHIKSKKDDFRERSKTITSILIFLIGLLFFRLLVIQVFRREKYSNSVQNQITLNKVLSGNRGAILDANGKELAYTVNMYELSVDPVRFMENNESAIKVLKHLIDKGYIKDDFNSLYEELKSGSEDKRRYKKLNNDIDDEEKKEIDGFLKENGLKSKNIFFLTRRRERRYYKPDMYFYLVGNVGFNKDSSEKEGVFGIEKYYENYLKGEKITSKVQGIRSSGINLPTSKIKSKVNLDGLNVNLTIDNDLQYILNEELSKQFKKTNAQQSYGIIMDPNNGKVLATAFFSKDKKVVANPVFQFQVEPGSIFKPLIVAAAMNKGKLNRYTKFDVGDGRITRFNHTIRESSSHTRGVITTEEILKKSSNVGMVLVSDKFTENEFDDTLKNYGFYEKTGIDYPYEKLPKRIPISEWNGLKKNTMAFGQGIAVTPIQMITAFSAVINGGHLYRPYIVDKITDSDGVVIRRNIPMLRRDVISPEVSAQMRDILELVVEEGTVKKAKVEGYRIGGKTGTAQFSEHGRYVRHEYLSSVMGFFPVEKPKYIILLMFFKPQGEVLYDKFGGTAAAPALGQIISRIVKVKGISSHDIESIKIEKENSTTDIPATQLREMPDLKGLSAREVLELFEKNKIKVEIKGTGVVESQSIEPGKSLDGVTEIEVQMGEKK